jgi:hypothetical protein
MTSRREPSLRADARRRYVEQAERERLAALARGDTPLSTSPRQGGREQAEAGGEGVSSLTDRVRALYEGSVVPVREIAAVAGVTERTLYKYVAKGGWRRRYAGRGDAAAAANRGRGHMAAPGFAPAKGAGGRFIAREDAGKPHARGLKALDPVGAREAVQRCECAAVRAEDAAAAAVASAARRRDVRRAESELRAFALLNAALVDLVRMQGEAGGAGTPRARRVAARLLAVILRQMTALAGNHGKRVA